MIGNAKISLIVAMTDDRVMAKDGGIPWAIPADVARYRRCIRNHVAIFGRKTLDDSYTETENIVMTRLPDYRPPTLAHVVRSVDEAFTQAEALLRAARDETLMQGEVFIIGGGEIFRQTIDRADKLYLTIVHRPIAGDTFFPDYSGFTKVLFRQERMDNGYPFTFLDLERGERRCSDVMPPAPMTLQSMGRNALNAI